MAPGVKTLSKFWNYLWGQAVQHNDNTEWLKDVQKELQNEEKQENISITEADVTKQMGQGIQEWTK